MDSHFFDKYIQSVERTDTIKYTGSVTAVRGLLIESHGPRSVVGELCQIQLNNGTSIDAEVVGFNGKTVKLMAYEGTEGIEEGNVVVASGHVLEVPVGRELLGRVINSRGKACDGKRDIHAEGFYPAIQKAPDPLSKTDLTERINTGVRAIDALITLAKGQRVGIFAGSGIGKSTLLSMIARNTSADINVIALIGERGREVGEFISNDLGEEGLKRSVIVYATGDETPISKVRAAYVATSIAEYFRDQGKNVMLMMDSVTRFAQAQRDIGTLNGEPPQRRGFPASSFTYTQKLLERTGSNDKGTITGLYTVLVDGGDFDEPVSDTVRGVLDGHILLSRQIQERQHYPAIDVLPSISRLMNKVTSTTPTIRKAAQRIKNWMAVYSQQEEMIISGVYQKGNSVEVDEAIAHHGEIEEFLCQDAYEECSLSDTLSKLAEVSGLAIPESEIKTALEA